MDQQSSLGEQFRTRQQKKFGELQIRQNTVAARQEQKLVRALEKFSKKLEKAIWKRAPLQEGSSLWQKFRHVSLGYYGSDSTIPFIVRQQQDVTWEKQKTALLESAAYKKILEICKKHNSYAGNFLSEEKTETHYVRQAGLSYETTISTWKMVVDLSQPFDKSPYAHLVSEQNSSSNKAGPTSPGV